MAYLYNRLSVHPNPAKAPQSSTKQIHMPPGVCIRKNTCHADSRYHPICQPKPEAAKRPRVVMHMLQVLQKCNLAAALRSAISFTGTPADWLLRYAESLQLARQHKSKAKGYIRQFAGNTELRQTRAARCMIPMEFTMRCFAPSPP